MNTHFTFAVVAAIVAALPATSMAEPTTIDVAGGLVFEFNPGADNCKLDDSHQSDSKLLHDRREASTPGSSYVVAIFIPCAQLAAFRAGTVDPTDLGILLVLNAKNGVAKQLKGADRPSVLDIAANTYRTEKVSVDAAKATARTQGDDPSEVVPFEPLGVLHIDDTAVYFGYRLPAEPKGAQNDYYMIGATTLVREFGLQYTLHRVGDETLITKTLAELKPIREAQNSVGSTLMESRGTG